VFTLPFISCLVLAGAIGAPAPDDGAAKERLAALVEASAKGDIQSIDVLRLPSYYTSLVSIGPEEMEERWFYRMTFRRLPPDKEKQLLETLRGASIHRTERGGDLRWAVVFHAKSGHRRIAALYFDESGRHGYVDQIPVSFPPNFFRKLKGVLPLSLE